MNWFQTGFSSAWCARQPFIVLRQKLLHGLVLVSPRHLGQCVIFTSPRTHASVGGIYDRYRKTSSSQALVNMLQLRGDLQQMPTSHSQALVNMFLLRGVYNK